MPRGKNQLCHPNIDRAISIPLNSEIKTMFGTRASSV
jgi:hypothetical protein